MRKLTLSIGAAVLATAGVAVAAPQMAGHMQADMTRAQAQTTAAEHFAKMDANGDGKLDQADRAARQAKMFDRIDADHNGSISRDEFAATHAQRGEPPLQSVREVPDQLGLGHVLVGDAGVVAAVARIDHDPLAQQARPGGRHRHHLAQQLRVAADDPPPQLAQRVQRRRAADPVRHQAVVALERAQCLGRGGAEHAVGTDQVVAELEQLLLERTDVVADQQLAGLVREHPVTEAPGGGHQGCVGLRAHGPVDRDCPALLEVADGKLTGHVLGDIVDAQGKADWLNRVCIELGLDRGQVIAMGDGANDLKMMAEAGISIAYRAKPVVRAQAAYALNQVGLDGLIPLLGENGRKG